MEQRCLDRGVRRPRVRVHVEGLRVLLVDTEDHGAAAVPWHLLLPVADVGRHASADRARKRRQVAPHRHDVLAQRRVVVRGRLRVIRRHRHEGQPAPEQPVVRGVRRVAADHLPCRVGRRPRLPVEEDRHARVLEQDVVARRSRAVEETELRLGPNQPVSALGQADAPVRDRVLCARFARRHAGALNAVVVHSVRPATRLVAGDDVIVSKDRPRLPRLRRPDHTALLVCGLHPQLEARIELNERVALVHEEQVVGRRTECEEGKSERRQHCMQILRDAAQEPPPAGAAATTTKLACAPRQLGVSNMTGTSRAVIK